MPNDTATIPTDYRILYFGRDCAAFGFLSHFFASPFELDGVLWPTVEHFYQAQKALDPAYVLAIRDSKTPARAKWLAAPPDAPRRVSKNSWFRKNKQMPRPDWHAVKLDIMRRADFAKFSQNLDLRQMLLATGNAELIEDALSVHTGESAQTVKGPAGRAAFSWKFAINSGSLLQAPDGCHVELLQGDLTR